ncbi:unnamed protein product [Meganyctiphanes norvegica]|uniref:Uncharacterized protein n=1 Tax=Meganyctiphanes norvegica TaxID=48144 RepID=A0AAV2SAL0_MEGNR
MCGHTESLGEIFFQCLQGYTLSIIPTAPSSFSFLFSMAWYSCISQSLIARMVVSIALLLILLSISGSGGSSSLLITTSSHVGISMSCSCHVSVSSSNTLSKLSSTGGSCELLFRGSS